MVWFDFIHHLLCASIRSSFLGPKTDVSEWFLLLVTFVPFRGNGCIKIVHILKFDYKTNPKIEFVDVFFIIGYRLCVLILQIQVWKKKVFQFKNFIQSQKSVKRFSFSFRPFVYKFYTPTFLQWWWTFP